MILVSASVAIGLKQATLGNLQLRACEKPSGGYYAKGQQCDKGTR